MIKWNELKLKKRRIKKMTVSSRIQQSVRTLLAVLLIVLSCAGVSLAKDLQEIKFTPGATSASVKGEIDGMDRDLYQVEGKAGQTMAVEVKNKAKLVLFHIQLPNEADKYLPKAGQDDDATSWKGKLPKDGKYTIVVGAMRGNDTKYTLNVEVK